MTTTLAIIGKSGSGKTTLTKAYMRLIKEYFPDKSILLFDNDLSTELAHTFGLDIRNTIYGIRTGKHEYKTGIPSKMTKQEYIDWALQDIVVEVEENVDIIVSWLIGSKDCRCPITEQIREAIEKLILNYDFVIFDCEFDLKYLNQLIDLEIDETLIIAQPQEESVDLAKRIEEYSAKYAAGGQMGVILNRVNNDQINHIYDLLHKYNLEILGVVPEDESLKNNAISKESQVVLDAIKQFYYRLNLHQNN